MNTISINVNEIHDASTQDSVKKAPKKSDDWSQKLEEMRSFLAKTTPFPVQVVRGGNKERSIDGSEHYPLLNNPSGLAVHICIQKNRKGSEYDMKMFNELYPQLSFHAKTFIDAVSQNVEGLDNVVTLDQCISWTKETLKGKNYSSLILYVSAHGCSEKIELADKAKVNIFRDVVYKFDGTRFPEFRHNPKIAVINTCQNFEEGWTLEYNDPTDFDPETEPPSHDNFLVWLSTSPGYLSKRNPLFGSYFMRANAYVFMKYAHELEINELCELVRDLLMEPGVVGQRPQMPDVRKFRFKKFYFKVAGAALTDGKRE